MRMGCCRMKVIRKVECYHCWGWNIEQNVTTAGVGTRRTVLSVTCPNDSAPLATSFIRKQNASTAGFGSLTYCPDSPVPYQLSCCSSSITQKVWNNISIVETNIQYSLFLHFATGLASLSSYWQNTYHHLDTDTRVKDADLTVYSSVIRQAIAQLTEVSSFLSDKISVCYIW